MRKIIFLLLFKVISTIGFAQHALTPMDYYAMRFVTAPLLSPEGDWILYSQSVVDSAKDKMESKLYMISKDGKESICLTEQTKGVSQYKWSPDGKYISYMTTGKPETNGAQIFLMNRKGGEGKQLTNIKGEIEQYEWLHNGTKILLAIKEFNNADTASSKVRMPYVMNRYKFKQDYAGYLDNRKTYLYLFDIATSKLDTLTRGSFNESEINVSHDDAWITYTSNVSVDPDKNDNTDIFLLSLQNGAIPEQITTYKGANVKPVFSPDNSKIAYLQQSTESVYGMYDMLQLGIYDIQKKSNTVVSKKYDRALANIVWFSDGKNILATVEDDAKQNIVSVNVLSGEITPFTNFNGVVENFMINEKGNIVGLFSDFDTPNEIYSFDGGTTKKISHIHDAFLRQVKIGSKKVIHSTSSDGNVVTSIVHLPEGSQKNLPLILFIHGGPVAQDEISFNLSSSIYAAAGYAVVNVNYRGSSGRGQAYTKAIYGDWGNKEVKDIVGVVNYLIKEGIVDSTKMGIAGWSYGGILTNYTIATDHRFKAAVSGAGSSLMLSFYGSDQYVNQYEMELGKPWENFKKWMDVSYPFFKVKTIKTPTLFMASQSDFNVPVIGAEQMYQAFKSEGIPTELIIYPNQNHGIRVPSYIVHRYNAHINWFNKYLQNK